jgi:uncharacterized membrane protein YfcA
MHGAPPLVFIPFGFAMVFAAGMIRGFTGFGFSIAAVPLLSLIMVPAQAIPLVLLLQLLVSTSGLWAARKLCDWRSIRLLSTGAVLATPIGAYALARLPAAPVRFGIAGIVIAAVVTLYGGFRLKVAPSWRTAVPFGALSGLFNGIAGMPGPPVIAFYLASPVTSAVARASMIVFFLATSIFGLVPLAAFGLINGWSVAAAALGFPLVWLGSTLGGRLYRRSTEARYRLIAVWLLMFTAAVAVIRAGFALAG